jgi:flagellar hook protein FlgE
MSFQQGLSGLNASSKNLDVIGHNVANANTYGEKVSRAEFADMYASAMNGSTAHMETGIGVRVAAVTQQFSQGSITSTENALDLAINGNGFFQVADSIGGIVYSRNGQFKVDREGFVVNNQNQKLVGHQADASGVIQTGRTDSLQMPVAGIKPAVTTSIKMALNLDARSKVTVPTTGPAINFADPLTYNKATSLNVFDEKGQDVALTYYFQKAATDTWNVYVTANGTSISTSGGVPAPATQIVFPPNGGTPVSPLPGLTLDIPASANAVGAVTRPIPNVTLNLAGATQYGSNFGVTELSQDGYAPGQLAGVSFSNDGVVTARYSNGQIKAAGQVLLANFRNPQGLQPLGGNAWAASRVAGDAVVGAPGEGTLGLVQGGALEESNIDLTAELVNMITAQRSYQANAQTIKTQDQVFQTLVNLR